MAEHPDHTQTRLYTALARLPGPPNVLALQTQRVADLERAWHAVAGEHLRDPEPPTLQEAREILVAMQRLATAGRIALARLHPSKDAPEADRLRAALLPFKESDHG